jgi:hypothetical protein|tara:strand:- start:287 stop:454 length:168 start_codon:yes stop_codon:yes gene_type:complete
MKRYRIEVQSTIIEFFEISAENKEDAEENYYDGKEVSWEQIESEILNVEEINDNT